MTQIPEDDRDKTWAILEERIQSNALNKDKSFVLEGEWKKFVRNESGYSVYEVDGAWIRRNLCVYFGHGGHGFVHEPIPLDEIWISSHHYSIENNDLLSCHCETREKGQKCSQNYFDNVVIHEITECEQMKKGKSFWESHQIALEKERQSGLLSDPYDDR